MIETIHQGFKAEGIEVSISKLCAWFGVPRRTFYYRSVTSPPKVQERFVKPIKAMIEEYPSFGGPSGCGKSTLAKLLTHALPKTLQVDAVVRLAAPRAVTAPDSQSLRGWS